jgi:hypothetical protein
VDIAAMSDDQFSSFSINFTRQVIFGCPTPFEDSAEYTAFGKAFNGRISSLSQLRLGEVSPPLMYIWPDISYHIETFGASLRGLLLRLAAGRVTSPDDVIRRLHWTSSGSPELEATKSLYIAAFTRYLKGCGRVCHPLLPPEELTENEKDIAPDDPLARSILFLMHIGSYPSVSNLRFHVLLFHQQLGPPASITFNI